jgi:uncharacterized protein
MEILHEDNGKKGHFYMEENGREIAGMYYVWAAEKMIIEHTDVDDAYGGRGLGKQLVKASVDYAREHNIKILPLCPFAKGVFDKVEEYRDVLV